MSPDDYAITFACYNQVDYTRQCVDSLIKHGIPLSRVVAVDNGSTDNTVSYLQSLPLGAHIFNKRNMSCGVAWNQGAWALQAEWTIIMNNDVIVSAGWVESLIAAARSLNVKVISPALIEGALDYDFESFSTTSARTMANVHRLGSRHAVCLAVHESVWFDAEYFRSAPRLLGYEDTLFFHELDKAGVRCAITGASWLHHFGSITQTAMKRERGLSMSANLPYRYNYRLLHQPWWQRKWNKFQRKQREQQWRSDELQRYGMTLHGVRRAGDFEWL
jgi:GT2 family glycosyltransferase